MASHLSVYLTVVVVLVTVASFSVSRSQGFVIPPASKRDVLSRTEAKLVENAQRLAQNGIQTAKRTNDIQPPREKRYTGYQDRASSFCTGLCMYEERKSYSECFDLCNWYMY